jgi:UDP-N-acetylmuramate--alanine ligase
MDLDKFNKVYFIGIGGIGVSAIARMMLLEGKVVSGSDANESEIVKELEKLGAKVHIGHAAKNITKDIDLVVYTPAVTDANPELAKARELGIEARSYPEMLGEISKNKYTIAVSGAHGKTTTTAIIGTMLRDLNMDPTIIVGSLLKGEKSNFVAGKGEYFVVEACEYKKSFLNLHPKIAVITNIDNDHLDYYGNVRNIQKAFAEFVRKIGPGGYLVCNPNGRYLAPIVKSAKCAVIDYATMPKNFNLKVVGDHNLDNAQAAYAVADILKTNLKEAQKSLENFEGTWRRFEYKGKTKNGALVYDDYGHHPTEIQATLAGARQAFPRNRIFCVFQPHLYSRTKLLLNDFAKSFANADAVLVLDIYAAREKDDGTHSRDLVKKIQKSHRNVRYAASFADAAAVLILEPKKGDVILTMGAGNVYKVGDLLF